MKLPYIWRFTIHQARRALLSTVFWCDPGAICAQGVTQICRGTFLRTTASRDNCAVELELLSALIPTFLGSRDRRCADWWWMVFVSACAIGYLEYLSLRVTINARSAAPSCCWSRRSGRGSELLLGRNPINGGVLRKEPRAFRLEKL